MKKIILILAVALYSAGNAQKTSIPSTQKFHFGVKGGGNLSWISPVDADKYRYFSEKIGFHGGLAAKYDITPKIKVESDILFNNLGTKTKLKEDESVTGKFQMNYIAVPILGQYEIIPKLYAETGPEFSFNLTSKFKGHGGTFDLEKDTKVFAFGWSLGAGYFLMDNLAANARFNFGLTTPFKDKNGLTGKGFRNNNFQLGFSYFFN